MGPAGSISHDGAELGSFGEGENLYAGWAGSAQGPGTRFSNGNLVYLIFLHYFA